MASGESNFEILAETPDLLVVNKPPGLLVHPTRPGGPWTLWDGINQLLAYEKASGATFGIINRLDRETSGLILVAKNQAAARRCSMAMEARLITKQYQAIVGGWPEQDVFPVDAPLLRAGEVGPSKVWLRRCVHPQGQEARTEFRVLARWQGTGNQKFALLEATPRTGRTHQIRVHLAYVGHPVLGDKIYGAGEENYLEFIRTGWTPALEARLGHWRHALHSCSLGLDWEGVWMEWQCPLAADLQAWLPPREVVD